MPGARPTPAGGVLLAKVIDNPELNNKEDLLRIAEELMDNDLLQLRQMAKEKIEEEREEEDKKIKGKYWVK